jgi:hypothetical protein
LPSLQRKSADAKESRRVITVSHVISVAPRFKFPGPQFSSHHQDDQPSHHDTDTRLPLFSTNSLFLHLQLTTRYCAILLAFGPAHSWAKWRRHEPDNATPTSDSSTNDILEHKHAAQSEKTNPVNNTRTHHHPTMNLRP